MRPSRDAMSKVASMRDAVAELVRDGDTVAIEGFTHLICFAAGHEIIRQRKRDLTLARMTPDVIYDQMIGAGVARKLIFSWLGNPGVGSLHAVRRRIEKQDPEPLEIEEYSHFGMVCRYVAGASNLPFFPHPLVLRERHPEREPEHQADDLAVRRRDRGLRRPAAQARRDDRPRAARDRRGRHADLGAARLPEGGGVRRGARDRRLRGGRRGGGRPPRPEPDRTRRRGRRRRGRAAVRLPPELRAGLLRPRQRLLREVGADLARTRARSRRGSRSGCTGSRTTTSTSRSSARASTTSSPARRCRARSTTGTTREPSSERRDGYTKNEIMIAASARTLGGETDLLRRRRAPEHRLQPRTANGRARAPARVRGRRVRRPAGAAPAVDRRPHARDGLDRGDVDVRAVRVLSPGRADRRGVPRRRADRPVREPQHDGDRRLRRTRRSVSPARAARARSRSTRGRSS